MTQERCIPGKCVGCGVDFEPSNQAEISCALSNGSVMRVGSCLKCCPTILNDKPALWRAVMAGWEHEQTKKGWDPEQKEKFKALMAEVYIQ